MKEPETSEPTKKDVMKERLESLAEERSAIAENIKQASSQTQDLAEKVGPEVSTVETQFSEDGKAISDYLYSMSDKIVSGLAATRTDITDTLSKSSNSLKLYLATQVFLVALVGILGGYYSWLISWAVFSAFAVGWAITGLVIVLDVRRQLNRIKGHAERITQSVDDFNKSIIVNKSQFPHPRHDTSALRKAVGLIKDAVLQVGSKASRYNPILSEIIDGNDKMVQRDQFIEKFSYALNRYGFDSYSDDVQRTFIANPDWSENQTLRLKALSGIASEQFGQVSPVIFELMYYETWERDNLVAVWNQVRKDNSLRLELARILVDHGLVRTKGTGDPANTVSNLLNRDNFDLSEAVSRSESFFENLTTFKKACLDVLKVYGLSKIVGVDEFYSMTPSAEEKDWHADVIQFLASKMPAGKDKQDVQPSSTADGTRESGENNSRFIAPAKLILLEGVGDGTRLEVWKEILHSDDADEMIRQLAILLTRKKLRKPSHEFSDEVFLRHLALVMKSSTEDFAPDSIERKVRKLEEDILQTKRGMIRMSTRFRLGMNDFEFANNFVPQGVDTVEDDLLSELKFHVDEDPDVLRLLYFSAIASDKAEELFRRMVKGAKNGSLEPLARFLIRRNFVPEHRFNENFATLISKQPAFDVSGLQAQYTKYDLLMTKLAAFKEFLRTREVLTDRPLPMFDEVVKICPPKENAEFGEMFVRVGGSMVTSKIGTVKLEEDRHSQLSMAACALSLQLEYDPAAEGLARKLRWKPYGARVLYIHSKLVTESVSKTGYASLLEAAIRAIPEIKDDPNFDFYLEKLQSGIVVPGANLLMAMRVSDLESIKERADQLGLENEVLHNYKDSTKELLSEINVNVTKDFLNQDVISAYLLTIPTTTALFGKMEKSKQRFKDAAKELADLKNDARYLTLLQYKQIGRATRIGLVPYGMRFETFTSMLDELFDRVLGGAKEEKKPSFYIVRIYPSEDSLKVILPSDYGGKQPIDLVNELVKEQGGGESDVILASLLEKSAGSNAAFKSVITKLIDGEKNNLLTLVKDLVSTVLSKNEQLNERFVNGAVDSVLRASYDARSLTAISKKVVDRIKATSQDTARQEFEGELIRAIPEAEGLSKIDRDILIQSIFKRIRAVGTVLYT